ncbi:MAG: hypothetical protein DMF03_08780 [Verrucomicrobia bacterium]|nr:MAG: hypothetical protein DMF03_08780 [Verrucomicrobiota bacterium]
MATGLLTGVVTVATALSIFARLQVAHINLFLFFAHITFLQLFFWFWVASVAPNSCRPPYELLVSNQVAQMDQLIF